MKYDKSLNTQKHQSRGLGDSIEKFTTATGIKAIVEKGSRIAQMVLTPVIKMNFEETEELPETIRGEGGFGSTGK